MRNIQTGYQGARVRVLVDYIIIENAGQGFARTQIDACPDRALVQVCLAAGTARRQANHRHDRIPAVDDHADVRHALVADFRKHGIELDAVFDQGRVRLAAHAVLSTDDIRRMVFELGFRDQYATGHPESAAFPVAAPRDDDDAVAAAAVRRLDDETFVLADDFRQPPYIALVANNAVKLRHRHAGLYSQCLGDQFVIDARVMLSRVEAHDVIGIAPVQAQHARCRQLFCTKHVSRPPPV